MKPNAIIISSLLSPKLINALPRLYATDNIKLRNKLVVCKFYLPEPYDWSWYVFEGKKLAAYQQNADGVYVFNDYLFYGMVHGVEHETSCFRLSELTEFQHPSSKKNLLQIDEQVFLRPYSDLHPVSGIKKNVQFEDPQYHTFKQWMQAQFDKTALADLCNHGAVNGFSGITTYSETSALYEKYYSDIWEMLVDDCEAQGFKSVFEMLAIFNCADVQTDAHFKNLLVWYAAEKIAYDITQGEYPDEDDESDGSTDTEDE